MTAILGLLSVGGILLMPASGARLLAACEPNSFRVWAWSFGACLALVLSVAALAVFKVLIPVPLAVQELIALPIIGILGNGVLLWLVCRSRLSPVEKRGWAIGHCLAALAIAGFCLKTNWFLELWRL